VYDKGEGDTMLQFETMRVPRPKKLAISTKVEIMGTGDHACVYAGQRGEIIARHDDPQKVQYLVALTCDHRCRWFFTRGQLRPVDDDLNHSMKN
jgi:hypothetical protein